MLRSRATGRLGILLNEDITCRLPVGLVERRRDAPRFHFPTCPRRVTAAPSQPQVTPGHAHPLYDPRQRRDSRNFADFIPSITLGKLYRWHRMESRTIAFIRALARAIANSVSLSLLIVKINFSFFLSSLNFSGGRVKSNDITFYLKHNR